MNEIKNEPISPVPNNFRILSLDGGGSKGCYSIGVLQSIETMLGSKLHNHFDLIYGTSTGAIIGSMIALGKSMAEIKDLYRTHIPKIMVGQKSYFRSSALSALAKESYEQSAFADVIVPLGVVTTNCLTDKPLIFKSSANQVHGARESFSPGFGVLLADAIEASCSATPFFEAKVIDSDVLGEITLIDGGFCANNPSLFAIVDAVNAMGASVSNLKVLSIGVGEYPIPKNWYQSMLEKWANINSKGSVDLLRQTLNTNSNTMEKICSLHHPNAEIVRINDTFADNKFATDLLESNLLKLDMMFRLGRESFGSNEKQLRELLT